MKPRPAAIAAGLFISFCFYLPLSVDSVISFVYNYFYRNIFGICANLLKITLPFCYNASRIARKELTMDKIDVNILRCLTEDARMNASQIGARVNLSVSAVIERMKKLEASGLIRSYTAVIDERLAGYDTQALISVRLEHPKYNESFTQQMHAISAVMECFYITGDFDYMARVCVSSTEELTKVLNHIKQIPGVSLTRTYVVLESIKQGTTVYPRIK